MAGILISRGMTAFVDEADLPLVSAYSWVAKPRCASNGGFYAITKGGRSTLYMHRLIMDAPAGTVVDHINGDGLDCRRSNLRVGDHTLNAINRRYANPTGFRGVYRNSAGTFRGRVRFKGDTHRTASFASAEEAARAYDELALTVQGAAALLNFPSEVRA